MDSIEHRAFIRGLPLLRSLDDGEIDTLVMNLVERRLKIGEQIFSEGDRGDACYFIVRGSLSVSIERNGGRHDLATLGAGQIFGHLALLDRGRRSATCTAAERTVILALCNSAFHKISGTATPLGFKLLELITKLLSSQLRAANTRLADLAARERQAEAPRSVHDPAVKQELSEVASYVHSLKLGDIDLLNDVEVVVSEADKYRNYRTR